MARRRKNEENIPDYLLEMIRVTPEITQASLSKLKYTITPRPEGKRPAKKYWCPYDGEYTTFRNSRDNDGSYPRCQKCNISIEDYWVKYYNDGW